MGGSKSQTVGYTYFKGIMAAIGNRIEQLLDINPDNKGWIMTPEQKQQLKVGRTSVMIDLPNLFGGNKKEGGWIGTIDVYVGEDDQPQSTYLAKQIDEDVSAYPNLSYLVFHAQDSLDKGFQLVSMSGMRKEFLLWVKRIHVKNDGSTQWYDAKSEIPEYTLIIPECGFYGTSPYELYNYRGDEVESKYTFVKSGNILNASDGSIFFVTDGDIRVRNFGNSKPEDVFIGFGIKVKLPQLSGVAVLKTHLYTIDSSLGENVKFHGDNLSIQSKYIGNGLTEFFIESTINLCIKNEIELIVEVRDLFWEEEYKNWTFSINFLKHEILLYSSGQPVRVSYGDINPIHKIREILTDYTTMGKPESDVNDENFRKIADRIYDEKLGISWCIQQKSCKEALEELEYHIEGGVRINRQTGLYEVILFRDDLLDLDDALHFDESNIKSFQPDIINAEDQINAVNVSFYDRENIKDSSFSLSDVGSFHTIDHENADDLKFPYFMNRRNAEMVANWKLKQLSTMAWKGSFTTGKYEARKLNKYDVVLLSWKSKNIVNLPVRVMNINLGNGRDNTVTLDFVEVVPYSNISYSSINVDPNPNPILPPQPNSSIVFEMPYFEAVQRMGQTSVDTELANNPEIGYLMAAAIKPQNNSLNALLYTDGGTGIYTEFDEVGVVEYCAACNLDQKISRTDTSFAVKSVKDLSRVKVGTLVQADDELLVYESYDTETNILTVKRGALDTIPKPHLKDAVFYFWDDSSGLDSTSYVEGETVKAQVLTTTPSGIQNLDPGNVQSLEIVGRANRPYPPANVKINGIYYPESTIVSNDIEMTWVDRNRLQQTGGNVLGFYDDGVTRESNVTYSLELSSENEVLYSQENLIANSHSIPSSVLVPNKAHKLKIWSVRDGFESYQTFEHNFFVEAVSLILTATVSKNKVVGSTVPVANINVVVDESLSANMQYDGSKISGKAQPGSTITIEVEE